MPNIQHPHVFLGGDCGRTTWRADIAIPRLEAEGITYYNPQYAEGEWERIPGLADVEAVAKDNAMQLLIVIGGETRAIATMIEAAEYICYGSFVHLVIKNMQPSIIEGQEVAGRELLDINRGRAYLRELVARRRPHLVIHNTIDEAVIAIVGIARVYGFGRVDESV